LPVVLARGDRVGDHRILPSCDEPIDLTITATDASWTALCEGNTGDAEVILTGPHARIRGLPPDGGVLPLANGVLAPLHGVSTSVVVTGPSSPIAFGCADGLWTATPPPGPSGQVQVDGTPSWLRLLAGRATVGDGLLQGWVRGDLVGLSHLTWMLEQPAWVDTVDHGLSDLLAAVAYLLDHRTALR